MKSYIEEELTKGFIRPSISPASAGFFFVKKKDGGLRPCIDYRALNDLTVKFCYPLPLDPAALEQLRTAKYFTKLDLRSAYNLIRIREGDEWKTAFSTTSEHYEYLVMPFGLVNSPSVFQAFINDVFRDMLNRWVIVYIDDILIYSDSYEDHVKQVRSVLQRLLTHQLYAKIEKCEFHQTSVSFLRYVISSGGVAMDDKKVQAVIDWPQPVTLKEFQRFLGLCQFLSAIHPQLQHSRSAHDIYAQRRGDNISCGHRQPFPPSRNLRKDSPRLLSCITQILNGNLSWRWMLPVLVLVRFSLNDMVILPNYTLVHFTHANSPPRNRIMMWAIENY